MGWHDGGIYGTAGLKMVVHARAYPSAVLGPLSPTIEVCRLLNSGPRLCSPSDMSRAAILVRMPTPRKKIPRCKTSGTDQMKTETEQTWLGDARIPDRPHGAIKMPVVTLSDASPTPPLTHRKHHKSCPYSTSPPVALLPLRERERQEGRYNPQAWIPRP
jgi:hypothetical protein